MSVKLALSRFFSYFFSKIKVYFVISSILVGFTASGVPRSLGRVRWAMEALKAIWRERWREVRIKKFNAEGPWKLGRPLGAYIQTELLIS